MGCLLCLDRAEQASDPQHNTGGSSFYFQRITKAIRLSSLDELEPRHHQGQPSDERAVPRDVVVELKERHSEQLQVRWYRKVAALRQPDDIELGHFFRLGDVG